MALSDKEAVAQSEVDAFMENCAKGGRLGGHVSTQATSEARHKRFAWVSRDRLWYGWHLTIGLCGGVLHGGREHMRGWEGRVCFTLFHLVCNFFWLICLARALACVWVLLVLLCLGGFVVSFFFWGKFDLNHMLIPVVDRPCLALVRHTLTNYPIGTLWETASFILCPWMACTVSIQKTDASIVI